MSELNNYKQQDEDLQEKQNEKQTEANKLSGKRKAVDALGSSEKGGAIDLEIPTKENKKVKKSKSSYIHESGSSINHDNIPAEADRVSTKQDSESQNTQLMETKCCKKACMRVVNSQVRQQLNQEYLRQLNQGREYGRSYLRKYFYPYKNSERFSDGTPMNVMFQFRIPPKVPFDDRDKKIEICQRAFMKIFELSDIWAPWHVKAEYGKWMKSRKSIPVPIFNFDTSFKVVYLVSIEFYSTSLSFIFTLPMITLLMTVPNLSAGEPIKMSSFCAFICCFF